MASRREQNMKYRRYSGRVNGNLAYDPAYEERQRRLRREREYEREHERQREEFMRPPQRKVQKKAAPVRRQREKVSLGTLCGFMALAAMVALMIMCRAQLTEISAQVVSVQKEISALEDEHVALLTRYEKTFDLTTIKEAAAAAGQAQRLAGLLHRPVGARQRGRLPAEEPERFVAGAHVAWQRRMRSGGIFQMSEAIHKE